MPLSPPAERTEFHLRRIECRGYQRADGLWDIEGHLVDTKSYDFDSHDRGHVGAGVPVHEMWLRLTIDDELLVHGAEASTDFGPYDLCQAATPNFAKLKGLRIGPGWRRAVHEAVGGTKGCTHLVELLGPLATTAFQTIWPILARRARSTAESQTKPRTIDSCHAYASDSPVVKRLWPAFYTGT